MIRDNAGEFVGYFYGVADAMNTILQPDTGMFFVNGETNSIWVWDTITKMWIDSNRTDSGMKGMLTDREGNSPADYRPSQERGIKEAYFYVAECEPESTKTITFVYFKNGADSLVVEIDNTSIISLYWNGDYWETSVVPMNVDLSKYAKETDVNQKTSELQNAIYIETNRATQAENNISSALQSETNRATQTEQALQSNIDKETTNRQNAITALQPNLFKGKLYLKNMDSTNTNFRIYTDEQKTQEFISNYVGGEVGKAWNASGDIAGIIISSWHRLLFIGSSYMIRFDYTDENGNILPNSTTEGGFWRKTERFTYHTLDEQVKWNKVVADFNAFLNSADTSNSTINRWKEIESFLKGITDTQTLTGLLESLRTDLQTNIEGNTTLINEETSRATEAERLLQVYINTEKERTANILQLSSVAEADVLSYYTSSTMYIVEGGKAVILLDVKSAAVGRVTQTLIKDGEILYRNNIKQMPSNGNTDASYWSEWSDKKATPIINWSTSFNMNDYKKQGVYYITGERLLSEYDNLPIMNASSGHTISGQLTVLDASLSDAEMCVTQYLKLTNRTGSEGKEYIRTYNKYSNGNEGWSVWKEIKQTANLNQISDEELKNYTENGLYEGVVNNGENPAPEQIARDISNFFEILERGGYAPLPTTAFFTMEVLNNYAVTQKMSQILGEEVPNTVVQRVKCVFPTLQYVEAYRVGYPISGFGAWTKINK